MKLSTIKAITIGLLTGVLVIAFNNCAQKLGDLQNVDEMSSTASDSSKMPIVADSEQASAMGTVDGLTNSAAAHNANKSLLDMFNQAKLFTSNSPSGPFVENGDVCKGQTSYFKMVGVSAGIVVKGCASPATSQGCLDLSKHRSFTASELVGGNIVTVITASESNSYPVGDYSFYISGSNQNTNIIHRVGVAKMKTCGGGTVARSCQFRITNPEAVFGGGVNIYPFTCDESNENKSGTIYYRTGSMPDKPFNAICECK